MARIAYRRHPHSPHPATTLLAALTVSVLPFAAACAPAPPPPQEQLSARTTHHELLPPGAHLDEPGEEPGEAGQPADWPGSLRPDDKTPEERIPEIYKRGRIIVGVDQSQYLLSFRDNASGELKGFEVDLAREIAKDIFGDPDPGRVDFRFIDSTMRTEAIVSGQVDIVVRTMSITKKRLEAIDFSAPYLDSSVRMLVPAASGIESTSDITDERICVADGSNVVDMARRTFPEQEILRTRTWTDCLVALQQFQTGALLGDETILAGAAAQDPLTTVTGEAIADQQYSVGIPKGNDGLTRQVNSTLERIRRDGTWDSMFNRWLSPHIGARSAPAPTYRPEETDNPDEPDTPDTAEGE